MEADRLTHHFFREHAGRMTAILVRRFGLRWEEVIADVVQDTFEAAVVQWRYGIPENPAGWLMRVAMNKAATRLRREDRYVSAGDDAGDLPASEDPWQSPADAPDSDDQLRLLLCCCQQLLPERQQVMLTLSVLCGFRNTEIASALLMSEEAVKKALQRAKSDLRASQTLFDAPAAIRSPAIIGTAHTVLYLLFNEGYRGDRKCSVIDHDLCYEAMRLTKLLLASDAPARGTSHALLALMLFTIARFPARLSDMDELISLREQDRTRWDARFIEEGHRQLREATRDEAPTRYHIEAIIASVHCAARHPAETDWPALVSLYQALEQITGSPHVRLNRWVAQTHVAVTDSSWHELGAIGACLPDADRYLIDAAEADLHERSGRMADALIAYRRALERCASPHDRRYLERKAATLTAGAS